MSQQNDQWFRGFLDWTKSFLSMVDNKEKSNGSGADTGTKARTRQLIISSGDISDVDGFFALAEYAKTDADVLFVMNYPAYVGVTDTVDDASYEGANLGQGYKYSAKDVFDKISDPPTEYSEFIKDYEIMENEDRKKVNDEAKAAMTDMAHQLASKVWNEMSPKGKLYFCVGGVNSVNPFSSKAVKNEMLVFASSLPKDPGSKKVSKILGDGCAEIAYNASDEKFLLSSYDEVYLDFNGSMAFFGAKNWLYEQLNTGSVPEKVRGAFVMGGVQAAETPKTMPSIKGTLNRFSCATMNQLYHPQNTRNFFEYVSKYKIPVFTVTNNVVHDLTTWDDEEHTQKTYDGVHDFLANNGLNGTFLAELADSYYNCKHGSPPPRKAFDFYVAFALRQYCTSHEHQLPSINRHLFYVAEFGVTIVSNSGDWHEALESYRRHIDLEKKDSDSPFIVAKKDSFRKELERLGTGVSPLVINVQDLHFDLNQSTHQLSLDHTDKRLIISSGDISDVDGFFALSEYAKSGTDTLFVMNYPAYVGVKPEQVVDDATYEQEKMGLGYRYSANEVLARSESEQDKYKEFMERYSGHEDKNALVKAAMTDLAFTITQLVWRDSSDASHRGRLFFCIGGVNSVNPFSRKAVKNEMLVFAQFAPPKEAQKLDPKEGAVYDEKGMLLEGGIDMASYDSIYMDFNGSMAFLSEESKLSSALQVAAKDGRLKGLFVMGGVQADEPPLTMPRIEGTLNRLSCATMNQLYHPENTGRLFALIAEHKVPTYLVSNNVVSDLTTWADEEHKTKTFDGVMSFLRSHGLHSAFFVGMARTYYDGGHGQPPRKVFDYYTATVLQAVIAGAKDAIPSSRKTLFYSASHGVSLVAANPCKGWDDARKRYAKHIQAIVDKPSDPTNVFVNKKKQSFAGEAKLLETLPPLQAVEVLDVARSINGLMRLSTTHRALAAGTKAVHAVVRLNSTIMRHRNTATQQATS